MTRYPINIAPEIERKMTDKERELIADIAKKASARKHKKKYTPEFIVNYMLETFKEWNYDTRIDAIDMLDAIFEIALKCGVMNNAQIKEERECMMNEYVDNQFDGEDI